MSSGRREESQLEGSTPRLDMDKDVVYCRYYQLRETNVYEKNTLSVSTVSGDPP